MNSTSQRILLHFFVLTCWYGQGHASLLSLSEDEALATADEVIVVQMISTKSVKIDSMFCGYLEELKVLSSIKGKILSGDELIVTSMYPTAPGHIYKYFLQRDDSGERYARRRADFTSRLGVSSMDESIKSCQRRMRPLLTIRSPIYLK